MTLCLTLASAITADAQTPSTETYEERLKAIEAAQFQLLTQIKILQSQIGELNARLLSLTTPPQRGSAPSSAVPTAPVSLAGAPRKGNKDAQVVLLEFSDFQCPFCGRFVNEAYQEIQKNYVQTGKVQLAFRHLPLTNLHPFALKASEAAACAGEQGKFWEMHDALFKDQAHLDDGSLRQSASTLQLDNTKFERCLTTSGAAMVQRDLATARTLQLSSTPSFLLGRIQPDGTMKIAQRISGAQPFAAFKTAIDGALAQK
jgi:protein-disulfide isomerase